MTWFDLIPYITWLKFTNLIRSVFPTFTVKLIIHINSGHTMSHAVTWVLLTAMLLTDASHIRKRTISELFSSRGQSCLKLNFNDNWLVINAICIRQSHRNHDTIWNFQHLMANFFLRIPIHDPPCESRRPSLMIIGIHVCTARDPKSFTSSKQEGTQTQDPSLDWKQHSKGMNTSIKVLSAYPILIKDVSSSCLTLHYKPAP